MRVFPHILEIVRAPTIMHEMVVNAAGVAHIVELGGSSPFCYPADISKEMIEVYRQQSRAR